MLNRSSIFSLLILFTGLKVCAQSDNCNTATSITLVNGQVCVSGTSLNSTTNNTTYGGCNGTGVNEVWYTYVSTGPVNDFTITPGTLTDAMIIVDPTGCADSAIAGCNTTTGSNTLNYSWGIAAGTQVYIGIASNGGTDGTFQFCVNSYSSLPGGGNACSGAIPVCDKNPIAVDSMTIFDNSGACPDCAGEAQQDMWLTFEVTQSGTLEWTAVPQSGSSEFDWALFDITSTGCPTFSCGIFGNFATPAPIVCNYNFGGQNGCNFGMSSSSATACPVGAITNTCPPDMCPATNVTAGNTYALYIDNYTNDNAGYDLTWGGTFEIAPIVDFTLNPSTVTCGTSVVVNITDNTAGVPDWTFGNGNTYSGNNPPAQTYSTPGVYAITAVVTGSCTSTHTEYVELFGPVTATSSSTDVSCGNCIGTASVFPAGGDGTFSYVWSNSGETTPTITGLCTGSYTVTVSNATCGTQVIETVVVGSAGLFPFTTSSTGTNCLADSSGTASFTALSGSPPYTYAWGNGQTTSTATGLFAGSYTVTVTDGAGCDTNTTVMVALGGLFPFTTASTGTNCTGDSSGTASFTVLAGSPPYTYAWANGQTASTATGLIAGTYVITVTDGTGCDTNTTIAVGDASPLVINSSSVVITNSGCVGSNGSIVGLTASGGTGTLTYTWLDASTAVVGTAPDLTSVGPNSYTLIVNDSNSCVETTIPYWILAAASVSISMTSDTTNCELSCDATGSVSVSGGTPPYFYTWNTSPIQTNAAATGLCAGTYFVTIMDASCSPSGIELVTNGNFSGGFTNFTSTYYNCNGSGCLGAAGGFAVGTDANFYNSGFTGADHTTGSGEFMVINGSTIAGSTIWCQTIAVTPNTNYQFSTWLSSLNVANLAIVQFTANGVPLGSTLNAPATTGTWTQFFETWNSDTNTTVNICITNQNTASGGNDFGLDDISFQECINACPAVDSVIIEEPAAMTVTVAVIEPLCYSSCDGVAGAIVVNGSAPYSYAWSNPGSSTTFLDSGLCDGMHTVSVIDSKGCNVIEAFTMTDPAALVLSGLKSAEKCDKADGWAHVDVGGGTPPFVFLWDDALSQTTDTALGLSGQVTPYTVEVTDSNGCIATLPFTISTSPGVAIDAIVATSLACSGETNAIASVGVTGSAPPFSYQWDDPSTQTNSSATGLGAGTYSITVTDAAGCDTSTFITIIDPSPITFSVSGTDTLCFGQSGAALNSVTGGGQVPYTYTWYDDPALTNIISTVDTVLFSPTVTATYTGIIEDFSGCTDTTSMEIYIGLPIVVTSSNDTTVCEGSSPNISVYASGGNFPSTNYSYIWDDPFISTMATITVGPILSQMTYDVTVTDGCSSPAYETVVVSMGPIPTAAFIAGCFPNTDVIQLTNNSSGNGGTILSWLWDFEDGITSTEQYPPDHDYAAPGLYTISLTVTSTVGCSHVFSRQITAPPTAAFTAYPEESSTANPTIEFIDASSSDVTLWTWDYGDDVVENTFIPSFSSGLSVTHTYDSAGIYKIVLYVENNGYCTDSAVQYVQIFEEYILFAPNVFTPNGNALNEVFRPVGVGIDKDNFEMFIYDRWGDLIYQTTDYNEGWDGRANRGQREAQSDVYVWVINTIDPTLGKHQYVGHVTLIK